MTVRIVILAAGKGTRMGASVPKVLLPIDGKPIVRHLLDAVRSSGLDPLPVVVVSPDGAAAVRAELGDACEYAIQNEPLGTGHAVACAREAAGESDAVVVLYGDHPFVSPDALRRLVAIHGNATGRAVTVMTTMVPSFEGWHSAFRHWGRVLRDARGQIVGIREYKDATESERDIREVNPALYCFNAPWLWENISRVKTANANGEYYLTDLVELAVAQGNEIGSSEIRPEESMGVNTPEEFALAERMYREGTNRA